MIVYFQTHEVLVQGTCIALVLALSIQVPMRMGVFSFAGAGCYGISAYLSAILVLERGFSPFAAIATSVVTTAAVGLVLGVIIQRLTGLYLAMVTFAFDLIIGVLVINGGNRTGGSTGLFGVITNFTTWHMLVLAAAAVTCAAVSELGRAGRRVEAVREDPELASSMGINVSRYRLVAFTASGALGGLAGAMTVMIRTTIAPRDIGFNLIVLGLTIIVVGGTRSWKGAVLGAVIITWLPSALTSIGEWNTLVYGVMTVIASIFLPRGLYGLWLSGVRWWQRHRRAPAPAPALPDDAPDATSRLALASPGSPGAAAIELGEGVK